jgi:Cytochrome c/c1 heme lyase
MSKCPVEHNQKAAVCPAQHSINPNNNIPEFSATELKQQNINLSLERETSGIPNSGEKEKKWEYPSPLQFYSALKRKGKEAPAKDIDTMVAIHNFINEVLYCFYPGILARNLEMGGKISLCL